MQAKAVLLVDWSDNGYLRYVLGKRGFEVLECKSNSLKKNLELNLFQFVIFSAHLTPQEIVAMAEYVWGIDPELGVLLLNEGEAVTTLESLRFEGIEVFQGTSVWERFANFLDWTLSSSRVMEGDAHTVVYVDDLESPRVIMENYFQRLGCEEVVTFESGPESLEYLQKHGETTICLVSDYKMPDMNGSSLIKAIRSSPTLRNLPVVILTANSTSDVVGECLQAGASGILVKPPRQKDVVRELNRARRIRKGRASPRLIPQ